MLTDFYSYLTNGLNDDYCHHGIVMFFFINFKSIFVVFELCESQ